MRKIPIFPASLWSKWSVWCMHFCFSGNCGRSRTHLWFSQSTCCFNSLALICHLLPLSKGQHSVSTDSAQTEKPEKSVSSHVARALHYHTSYMGKHCRRIKSHSEYQKRCYKDRVGAYRPSMEYQSSTWGCQAGLLPHQGSNSPDVGGFTICWLIGFTICFPAPIAEASKLK